MKMPDPREAASPLPCTNWSKANIQAPQSHARYTVREPRTVQELEELLRLRYRVFRASKLRLFTSENPSGMDVDAWDKHAWHVGLYKRTEAGSRPLGYMRIIHNRPERSPLMLELGTRHPALKEIIGRQAPAAMPFADRRADAGIELFTAVRSGTVAEVSRFSLADEEGGPRLCRFFVESVIAIFHLKRVENLVFEVSEHHLAFYLAYGYREIARCYYPQYDFSGVLIHANRNALAPKRLPRLQQMAAAFAVAGRICFNRAQPDSFYAQESALAYQKFSKKITRPV